MTDRELMQQALESIEMFFAYGYNHREECIQIIAALRERLARLGGTCKDCLQVEPSAEPVQPNEVLFAVEIPEGYEETHPELLGVDAFAGKQWVRWRVVAAPEHGIGDKK